MCLYSEITITNSQCMSLYSCLQNQPFLLWRKEKVSLCKCQLKPLHYLCTLQALQSQRKKGEYMLHNFGKVHSVPHTRGLVNYQLNFLADRPTKSLIMISMVADDLKVIVHKSPGRIVEAYIEAFEALSTTGDLLVIVQNIGGLTASYNVSPIVLQSLHSLCVHVYSVLGL